MGLLEDMNQRVEKCGIIDVSGNGCRTGIFGKWHLGDSYPFRLQDRGFHEVLIHSAGRVTGHERGTFPCFFQQSGP